MDLVNVERKAQGLGPVTADPALMAAARERSKQAATGNLRHILPAGAAGENLAWGQRSPEKVVADWMADPPHRANILNPGWTRIGVGNTDAGWAQDFA